MRWRIEAEAPLVIGNVCLFGFLGDQHTAARLFFHIPFAEGDTFIKYSCATCTHTHTLISLCISPDISLENGWYTRMQIFPLIPRSLFYIFCSLHPSGTSISFIPETSRDWNIACPRIEPIFACSFLAEERVGERVTVVSWNKRMRARGPARRLFCPEMRISPGWRAGKYEDLLEVQSKAPRRDIFTIAQPILKLKTIQIIL